MPHASRFLSATACALVLAGLAACGSVPLGSFPAQTPQYPAQTSYPAQYPGQVQYPAQTQQSNVVEYGRVTNLQVLQAQQEAQASGVGAILGGVAGAVVGRQIGGGNGRNVATVVGAVGGAVAGNAIEKSRSAGTVTQSYRVTVQLDNGSARAYDLPSSGDLRIGDRVRVQNGQLFRY
jgi:outer membrane lipoprotein SlyB